MTETYRVVDYFDVWKEQDPEGNPCWQVNNLCEAGYIEVKDYTSVEELVEKVQNLDRPFLNVNAKAEDFEVWNDYDMIEFSDKSNGCPLFRLERQQN